MKKFGLVKYQSYNLLLEVRGGYSTDEERGIISRAGWKQDDVEKKIPRLPDSAFDDAPYMVAEHFHAPSGSGIFGGHTKTEAQRYKMAIKESFASAGIPLYERRGHPREML